MTRNRTSTGRYTWPLFALLALCAHVLLRYTDIGRNIYAIGGNDVAARLAGININKYILAVYALTGIVAGLAGVLITARTGKILDQRQVLGTTNFFVTAGSSGADLLTADSVRDQHQAMPLAVEDLATRLTSLLSEGW